MFYEISRRSININKREDTAIIHHDSILTLRADKHLHLLSYSYNISCLDKKLDFVESAIQCPKNSAASELLSEYARKGIPNTELNELITNPYFWPYSSVLKQEMTNIMSYQWSPPNFIHNNQCVLAILNTVGNIEFFSPRNKVWTSVINFSSIIYQCIMSGGVHAEGQKIRNINELKDIVYSISTSAMSWASNLNEDGSCHFVTAQRNGILFFCKLKFQEYDLKVDVMGTIKADDVEITAISWIPCDEKSFLILYSNALGEVTGKVFNVDKDTVNELLTIKLWKYRDKMVPKNILSMSLENRKIIIYAKHRHLVAQLLDENFNVISECAKIVNDEKITAVTKAKNGIYVASINTDIYKVNLLVNQNNLSMDFHHIPLKDSYSSHDLYGMAFSGNDVLCHIILVDRKIHYRKEQLKILVVSLTTEESPNEKLLLNNVSNKLTNMWDCIELMRCQTMKTKKLPSLDYETFYEDAETNIYKLKIYLIFLKLYNSLEYILKNLSKGLLPETSVEVIQDNLSVLHASKCVMNFYEKSKNNKSLTDFESEWLDGCCKFIEFYCKKYKVAREKFISNDKWKKAKPVKSELSENICQFCDDKLSDFTCSSGHINIFCSVTFTQILNSDYLVCKSCNVTARVELYEYKPQCVFCDCYLDYYDLVALV